MVDITSRRFTIVVHIIFWAVYFLVNGASYSRFVGLPDVYLKILLTAAVHIGLVTVNLELLLPRLFLKRKFAVYIAIMVPLFFGVVFLLMLIDHNWADQEGSVLQAFNWASFAGAFLSSFIVLTMTALLKFLQEWYKQQEKNRELAFSQLQAEHKMLRMQVNPHFLFNALNNIYSLSWKKSDAAAPAILKLAELMRYLLYDSAEKQVSLQTEVDYIQNYIGLQKLKYGDTDQILFTTKGINSVLIDPLLFIPFVENAFKHGNLGDPEAFIKIRVELDGPHLEFRISNTFNPDDEKKDEVGGIGIENVRSRLQTFYPGKHQLELGNDGHIYSVLLTIDLEE